MPPEGQGMHAGQLRFDLTPGPETRPDAILLSDLPSKAQAQTGESKPVFRRLVRSCRRWQLTICSQVLRGLLPPRHAPGYVRSTSKPERPRKTCSKNMTARSGKSSDRSAFHGESTPIAGKDQRCLRILPFSRCQSRSFSVRRLSCCFLPLASAISTLTLPRLQYMAVGISV